MRFEVNRLRYSSFPAVLVLCFAASLVGHAQVSSANPNSDIGAGGLIRGRVVLPNGAFLSEGVRVSLATIRGVEASVFTDNSGRFEFSRLIPGKYQVAAEADRERFEIVTESIEVVRNQPVFLNLVLKEKAQPGRPKAASLKGRRTRGA